MIFGRMSLTSDSGGTRGADNNFARITPTNIPEYAKTPINGWRDKPGAASKNLNRERKPVGG